MLSILIPTYNYNCSKLITDLHQQAEQCHIDYEIIIADDGSTIAPDWLARFEKVPHIKIIRNEKNVGRAAIRNSLADVAQYPYLLFMDNDASVCRQDYIAKYLDHVTMATVVVGGTAYTQEPLPECYSLRLTYGRQREANQNYNNYFTTFNFAMSKKLFQTIQFNTSIQGYGHEDFLFGLELKKRGIKIVNIDNPLIHEGLDTNITFIHKTEEANSNLLKIYTDNPNLPIAETSKLLNAYLRLSRYKLISLAAWMFNQSKPLLIKQLTSEHPNLIVFDIYKLGHLCQYVRKSQYMST